jgi:hypothetical protein
MERHWSVPAIAAFVAVTVIGPWIAPKSAEAQVRSPGTTSRPPARCLPVDAGLIGAPYALEYGLTADDLQSRYFGSTTDPNDGSFNDQGYRPVRLTGYVDDGDVRYATKWVRDAGPAWNARAGLTGAQFHARYLAMQNDYLLLDASGYNTAAGTRYADIWLKNTAGLKWAVTRDVPANQMDALKLAKRSEGLAPTHIEGYIGPDLQPQFIITWIESSCEWAMEEDLTGDQYQAFFDASAATMRPVHADAYTYDTSLVRFAGIFWRQAGPAFRASHGQHWYGFQATTNHNICDGFEPDSVYGMELPDGWNAFGAVWSYAGTPAVSAASSLGTRVNYRVNCAPGRAGAALINLTTGETVLSHADQKFGTASACKAWVLFALLRKADAEGIDLDTTVLTAKTLTTLATEMIVNSNNTSTNTLIDYVGMTNVNDELTDLGLEISGIQRHLTGGTSVHGLGNWFDDYKAGYDNFTTPRELATFWGLVFQNDGLLSADAYGRFLSITGSAPTTANDVLDAGYDPASVVYFNKAGAKTYNGIVGDFAHRPQLASHRVRSEGGVMQFTNGNLVFYAVISDETDPLVASDSTIACVGWEAAKQWGGSDPGTSGGTCIFP